MARNPETKSVPSKKVWYCVRRKGVPKHEGWLTDTLNDALPRCVGAGHDHVIEVCRIDSFRPVKLKEFSRVFYNRARGVIGMEITFRGDIVLLPPTRMIAANLSFDRALQKFRAKHRTSTDDFATDGGLRAFSARQYLLYGDRSRRAVELFRGSSIVASTPANVEHRANELAEGIGSWMVNNLNEKGALPYKYWPSRGVDSPADNAIRRFLGSIALARLAKFKGSARLRDAASRNLQYNLQRYFRNIGNGCGVIVEDTGAKLGAASLAALAILESPVRREFSHQLKMLATGINSLVHEEHGFRTFFFPPERDGENWNFYSGEALLFWAEAIRSGLEFAPSLQRFSDVFDRCRARHYQSRNPAFVPWFTQACSSLFAHTGRREFADFAFEICDWLLPMQQWRGLPSDMQGRFYDPKRPEFGPPHAASTGAYLEGLADALTVARMVGDSNRTATYARAVDRGLRSLRQLQFRESIDAFYISKKHRVMGALRTEVYDNSVRVDSAAHALVAVLKILHPLESDARSNQVINRVP